MGLSNILAVKRKNLGRTYRRFKYRHYASTTSFDWDWQAPQYSRKAVINYLVSISGGLDCEYLEIGCAGNDLFDAVYSQKKVGVDPAAGGTHRMTSDDFFANNERRFDVIFIDGLHEYVQVHKDTTNALSCLKPGGWIVYHDLLPRDWKEQHVPRLQATWTGDCWKIAIELLNSEALDFRILMIDHGVGVMQPTSPEAALVDMHSELMPATYDYFVNLVDRLPRVDWAGGIEWIQSRRQTENK